MPRTEFEIVIAEDGSTHKLAFDLAPCLRACGRTLQLLDAVIDALPEWSADRAELYAEREKLSDLIEKHLQDVQ